MNTRFTHLSFSLNAGDSSISSPLSFSQSQPLDFITQRGSVSVETFNQTDAESWHDGQRNLALLWTVFPKKVDIYKTENMNL